MTMSFVYHTILDQFGKTHGAEDIALQEKENQVWT